VLRPKIGHENIATMAASSFIGLTLLCSFLFFGVQLKQRSNGKNASIAWLVMAIIVL
jgi:hypothetical protein